MKVPGLSRKFQLLIEYGEYNSIPQLAQKFDVATSTLYGWGHGANDRLSDTLPSKHVEMLIKIAAACIPAHYPNDHVQSLLEGPLSEFEIELKLHTHQSLNTIINNEALVGSGRLIPKSVNVNAGLIETDDKAIDRSSPTSIPMGEWFRIEFDLTRKEGHFIALQHADQNWRLLPTHLISANKLLLLPGLKINGQKSFMRERRQSGMHRFIALQINEPPPQEIHRYLADDIELDGQGLRLISQFFDEQPTTRREAYLFPVKVKAPPSHSADQTTP